MKWLLVFPVSDLLRAISVIKEKKNKQGPLIMIEDKHGGVSAQEGESFVSFSHTIHGRLLKLDSCLRCVVRIADFFGLFAAVFIKVSYDSARLLKENMGKNILFSDVYFSCRNQIPHSLKFRPEGGTLLFLASWESLHQLGETWMYPREHFWLQSRKLHPGRSSLLHSSQRPGELEGPWNKHREGPNYQG